MIERLVYLGWVLIGALAAAALSLGIGWLVGAFWIGFAITTVLGAVAFLFGDRVVERIDHMGLLSGARTSGRHHGGERRESVDRHEGRHRKP